MLVASVLRWFAQGSGNLYTALSKRFYVADPDFDWRESTQRPIWVGLEVIALIAGGLVVVIIVGLWIRRRERRLQRRATGLRVLSWLVALAPAVVPIAAFVSGPGPADARETRPEGSIAAPTTGIEGSLQLPAGRYDVIAHRGTVVTARIKAGGDEFDAVFTGDPQGSWEADPQSFAAAMSTEVSLAAASVDTGVDLRSEHARGEYLQTAKYPRIGFALLRLVASRQDSPTQVTFRGIGEIEMLAKKTEVEVTGTIEQADDAKKQRLGLGDVAAVALVKAQFILPLKLTALTANDYDTDRFPIKVSLVLVHRK